MRTAREDTTPVETVAAADDGSESAGRPGEQAPGDGRLPAVSDGRDGAVATRQLEALDGVGP